VNGKVETFRLTPGTDLRTGIEDACRKRRLGAVAIVTCVVSLSHARLRLANADRIEDVSGPLEIVSLAGTVSAGGAHLHTAVADANGRVTGGHLAYGSLVFTTAEVVVIEDVSAVFDRVFDPTTGYRELAIRKRRKR
jgi:predicted DNA-binding protein with PD1-like motif